MKTALNYKVLQEDPEKEKEAITAMSQQAIATNAVASTMARNPMVSGQLAMPTNTGFANTQR